MEKSLDGPGAAFHIIVLEPTDVMERNDGAGVAES
jgi:hypothetical protein